MFNSQFITALLSMTHLFSLSVKADFITRSNYRLNTHIQCGEFPRLNVETTKGLCLGMMISREQGLKMPRYAVQSPDGIIYVSDMGGWDYSSGRILAIYKDQVGQYQVVNLFKNKKLTMPNGLLIDPEGRLYIGLPTGIYRIQPTKKNGEKVEFNFDPPMEVVSESIKNSIFRKGEFSSALGYLQTSKPNKNKHPLLQLAANKDFTRIYYNVGAPSNDCGYGYKTTNEKGECIQAESPLASAAIWELTLSNDPQRKVLQDKVFARGLRNSMALQVHSSGRVYQADNGIDLPDEDKPYEEINLVEFGKHYGWPYCHSAGEVSPRFTQTMNKQQCSSKYEKPVMFLQAHSAPLSILISTTADVYGQNQINHRRQNAESYLLISLHGYKPSGHRIVSVGLSQEGLLSEKQSSEVVTNWVADGVTRPTGAPVGITRLNDGRILIVDDKNASIYVMAQTDETLPDQKNFMEKENQAYVIQAKSIEAIKPLQPWFVKNCALCHQEFKANSPEDLIKNLVQNMVDRENPEKSKILEKLNKQEMPPEMIRQSIAFKNTDYPMIIDKLKIFLNTL